MRYNSSQKGFVLFVALLAILFAVLLYGLMQENLRLASFVELHAEQNILSRKNCELAVKKIIEKNSSGCESCEIKVNNQELKYKLEKIVLESSESEGGSENKNESVFVKLNIDCSAGQHVYGLAEVFADAVNKKILSWKLK